METINIWAEMSSAATNAREKHAPDTHVRNAIRSTDIAKIHRVAKKTKSNVRTGNSSYCLPKKRKRSVPFPTLRSTYLLRTKVRRFWRKSKIELFAGTLGKPNGDASSTNNSISVEKEVIWTLPAVGSSTNADATGVNHGNNRGRNRHQQEFSTKHSFCRQKYKKLR